MSKLVLRYYPHLRGYIVTCPDFPNVRAFGHTKEDAIHAAEVIEMWR